MSIFNDLVDSFMGSYRKREDEEQEKVREYGRRPIYEESSFEPEPSPSLRESLVSGFTQAGSRAQEFLRSSGEAIETFTKKSLDDPINIPFAPRVREDGQLGFTPREIGGFAKDTLQAFPRAIAETTMSTAGAFNENVPKEFDPEDSVGRFLFGDESLKQFQYQPEDRFSKRLANLAPVSDDMKTPLAMGLSLVGGASDLIPGVDDIVKKGGKEVVDEGVQKILGKNIDEFAGKLFYGGGADDSFMKLIPRIEELQNAGKTTNEIYDSLASELSATLRPSSSTGMAGTKVLDSSPSLKADTPSASSTTTNRSPSYKYTPDTSPDDVLKDESFITTYNNTTKEEPYLQQLLKDISGDNQYTTNLKAKETAAGKIVRKIKEGKLDYDESRISDLLRGNVVTKSTDEALAALENLKKNANIAGIEDYFTNPTPFGYHGINVNIVTPGGNKAEIQIHTPKSIEIQNALHPIYEAWRDTPGKVPVEVMNQTRKIVSDINAKYGDAPLDPLPLVAKTTETPVGQVLDASTIKKMDLNKAPSDIPEGMKERKFIETVRESPTSKPELAQGVEGIYKPQTNKGQLEAAQKRIETNLDEAIQFARTKDVPAEFEGEKVATQQLLMMKYQNEGNFEAAIDMAETAAEQATSKGQAIQALSMWGRLTPEGALRAAQRAVKKANDARPKGAKKIELTPETAQKITEKAKEVQSLPDGSREKQIATGELLNTITEDVPPSLWEKISSLQALAQLLNPKTAIRNVAGNAFFFGLENLKDVVATPLDMVAGVFTGKRTKTLPDIATQARGAKKGFIEGLEDADLGIDTSSAAGKHDIKKPVFKNPVLKYAEKLLNAELKAPDRAAYQATYDESLRQQMKLNKVDKPTDEMMEIAHKDGLYRTFQDDNIVSKVFSKIKSALNAGGEWGLGDMVLKYPKTPGAIAMRAIEYSPAGFIQSVLELGKPLIGREFDQKQFVESTSRALVGSTGLVGTGAILHKLGIITGNEKEMDQDIKYLDKEQGLGNYKFNVSALKRFVMSGMDPEEAARQEGDRIVSYDWFQPMAIGLAMGADIDAAGGLDGSFVGKLTNSIAAGSDSLAELPLVQGVKRFTNYGDLPGGVVETLTSVPASFVPTLLNQVKQLVDNTSRNPEDPDPFQKAINLVKMKTPGLSDDLPPNVGVQGQNLETYQNGSNNVFNVMLNPSFVSEIKTTPEGREVMRIYNDVGMADQAPRKVDRSIEVNGERKKLNGEEIAEYQRFVGTRTQSRYKELIENPRFQKLDDEEKAQVMAQEMSEIHQAAKIILFGQQYKKKPSKDVRRILKEEGFNKLPLVAPN